MVIQSSDSPSPPNQADGQRVSRPPSEPRGFDNRPSVTSGDRLWRGLAAPQRIDWHLAVRPSRALQVIATDGMHTFSTIEFTNPERTKASVPVTVGYSGGIVLLEKVGGEWRAIEIFNQWVT